MNKHDVLRDIDSLSQLIAAARQELQNDRLVEMGDVQDRIRNCMTAVADLPQEEAIELRPLIVQLGQDLESFSTELQEKIKAIAADDAGPVDTDDAGSDSDD